MRGTPVTREEETRRGLLWPVQGASSVCNVQEVAIMKHAHSTSNAQLARMRGTALLQPRQACCSSAARNGASSISCTHGTATAAMNQPSCSDSAKPGAEPYTEICCSLPAM